MVDTQHREEDKVDLPRPFLISASCMYLKLKTVPRLRGSKPALPGMVSSSSTAGCSMNGIDGEIFIDTRAWDTWRVETDAPATPLPKPKTGVETNPIILTSGFAGGVSTVLRDC